MFVFVFVCFEIRCTMCKNHAWSCAKVTKTWRLVGDRNMSKIEASIQAMKSLPNTRRKITLLVNKILPVAVSVHGLPVLPVIHPKNALSMHRCGMVLNIDIDSNRRPKMDTSRDAN